MAKRALRAKTSGTAAPAAKKKSAKKKVAKKAPKKKPAKRPKKKPAAATKVMAWEDDPRSGRQPIKRPIPNPRLALKFKINGTAVRAGIYARGTNEFRYWAAAEALRRCSDFWTPLVGSKARWHMGPTLPVSLDAGDELNASYDREELTFYHGAAANGTIIFTCESPDLVAHEMGHALLDAVRPELYHAPYAETAAFHEFMGDASAILSALQLPSVVADAANALERNRKSFLSRCAEELGWALRSYDPADADPDSLRNACNKFKYIDPDTLPEDAPAKELSAEFHSFSRVFAGAFYEILGGMTKISSVDVAARDMGKLLLKAIADAPVDPRYYAQIAAHMIDADASLLRGKYRTPLTKAFVARHILPARAVQALVKGKKRGGASAHGMAAMGAAPAVTTATRKVELDATKFGLTKPIVVTAPVVQKSRAMAAAAANHAISASAANIKTAAGKFVDVLFAHNRVEAPTQPSRGAIAMAAPNRRTSPKLKTHVLVNEKEGFQLKRIRFLCGCSQLGEHC